MKKEIRASREVILFEESVLTPWQTLEFELALLRGEVRRDIERLAISKGIVRITLSATYEAE